MFNKNPRSRPKLASRSIKYFFAVSVPIVLVIIFSTPLQEQVHKLLVSIGISKHYVYDCRDGQNDCQRRSLEYNILDCEEYWGYEDYSEPNCTKTKKGLTKISYITDPANYIPSPITKEKYTAELLIKRLGGFDLEIASNGEVFVVSHKGILMSLKEGNISYFPLPKKDREYLAVSPNGLGISVKGFALDPEFIHNGKFYVYITYKIDSDHFTNKNPEIIKGVRRVINKVVSYTLKNGEVVETKVLLDDIPGSGFHQGGRVDFGPDGKLYVTTGDAEEWEESYNPDFLGGKILRMNPDGSIPKDNPFQGSYVYSMGHRNPQGLTWNLKTNDMYSSEHGNWRKDEINKIVRGGNYGWGVYQCGEFTNQVPSHNLSLDLTKTPIICTDTWTIAPSGIEFVSDESSPWYGSLFVSSLRGKHVHRYTFDENRVLIDEIFFIPSLHLKGAGQVESRMRDVEYFDGSLYVLSNGGDLIKISPEE